MSAILDQTLEDVDILEGATIEKVWLADWDDGFEKFEKGVVRFRVRYRDNLRVNDSLTGEFEVWQDGEGNGPGFIALVG